MFTVGRIDLKTNVYIYLNLSFLVIEKYALYVILYHIVY